MTLKIDVIEPKGEAVKSMFGDNFTQNQVDALSEFNKQVEASMNATYEQCLKECQNENQKTIFNDWWKSEKIYGEEYQSRFSKEDFHYANGIVLWAVSNGCG